MGGNIKSVMLSKILGGLIKAKDTAYHGSPFNFNAIDIAKIGTGEGAAKRGLGLYLHRNKKFAPYYANIRSKDAPIHLGSTKRLENTTPTIYTFSGLNSLQLKQVTEIEARNIARKQRAFQQENPIIDGLELPSGELCIFPESVFKLKMSGKCGIDEFVASNPNVNFRQWTTDTSRLIK